MILPLFTLPLLACMCISSEAKDLDCSKVANSTNALTIKRSDKPRGDRFSEFDWSLSKELSHEKKGNLVVSPISLKVVLAMLYEGARGQTAREISEALSLASDSTRPYSRERFSSILHSLQTSKGQYDINMGTHVFIDTSAVPNPTYQCKLKLFYNSDMESVDFKNSAAAAATINTWARNVTEGHIQNLISEAEANSNTVMLLLNAIYFKGLWEKPFFMNQTKPNRFHLNNKDTVEVQMMNTKDDFKYLNMPDLDAQIIRLPYLGQKFAMYVVLPNSKTGLSSLIQSLGPNRPLTSYIANMTEAPINLSMPKFEFDFTTSLRQALEKLNIKTMFSAAAELSDIAEASTQGLVVSNVFQKAGISVNEVGTVGYVATAVGIMNKFGDSDVYIDFNIDRPFLFFIEDEREKTIVFVGKVTQPDLAQAASGQTQPLPPTSVTAAPPNGATKFPPTAAAPTPEPGVESSNEELDRIDASTEDQQASKARFNFFDATLLKEFAKNEGGNFIISPSSIKALLGMILEGAEGMTLKQMKNILQLPTNTAKAHALLSALHNALKEEKATGVTVDSYSQVYLNNKLTPNATYDRTIKQLYGATVSRKDFSDPNKAASSINDDISRRTHSQISNVISPEFISPTSYAVLLNTLYFKGTWKYVFARAATKPSCFYSEPDVCETTQMMSLTDTKLAYRFDKVLDTHILRIPYQDERFSMVIVLPSKKDGMGQLNYNSDKLTFPGLLTNLREVEVSLRIPKFTVEYGIELTDILKEIGLEKLFSKEAEIPYMIQSRHGKVSAVVHKAKIEVSEEGTTASAATAGGIVPLINTGTITVNVDHPFMYFIYEEESASVLFAGRLSSVPGAETRPADSQSGASSSRVNVLHETSIQYPNRNHQRNRHTR